MPRRIEASIEVSAPPDALWRAMTVADELVKWFAWSATSSPGVGGPLDLHWGKDIHWPMVVRVWDPPKHVH
jgi:uncharacterized protein YndB with AHSA1/START domain